MAASPRKRSRQTVDIGEDILGPYFASAMLLFIMALTAAGINMVFHISGRDATGLTVILFGFAFLYRIQDKLKRLESFLRAGQDGTVDASEVTDAYMRGLRDGREESSASHD